MKDISYDIIGCAYEVHRTLGPGLLESVYQKALVQELKLRGFNVKSEVDIEINYKGVNVGSDLRLDIIVNDTIIIELKSVETILPIHKKQLLTYLRLTNLQLGLLINFNTNLLKDGITRIVNNFNE
ncbi:MAG: GxxExxY protein [Bacteroidales bacterium]|nr:GxxExxY protein [Bacteroidales bacterium]MEE1251996.1 GxxExxY protein [Bacteroidales bacterium]